MFYPSERIVLFIDGANTHAAAKALGLDIDFSKLLAEFGKLGHMVRANYFTAIAEDAEDYSPIRPLVDWLDYNGFSLTTKLSREYTDAAGRVRYRGDTRVELAVAMLEAAPTCEHMVLFSGDGDYESAVEAVQRKGVRVTVVSTIKSTPPMLSDSLRRRADAFIDIESLEKITRIKQPRAPRIDRD